MKKIWHVYAQITSALFLFWFTQTLLLGGNYALNGFADSTGYYLDYYGLVRVSAVTYYSSLISSISLLGFIPVVIKFSIHQMILSLKTIFRKPDKQKNRLAGLYERKGLALSVEFPYYVMHMIKDDGNIKERYNNMLSDMKITGYEVVDAGLGFYAVCMMMIILAFAFAQRCGIV